jgi:hypothetical protein
MGAHSSHARFACESVLRADLRRSASKFGWLQRVDLSGSLSRERVVSGSLSRGG